MATLVCAVISIVPSALIFAVVPPEMLRIMPMITSSWRMRKCLVVRSGFEFVLIQMRLVDGMEVSDKGRHDTVGVRVGRGSAIYSLARTPMVARRSGDTQTATRKIHPSAFLKPWRRQTATAATRRGR